MTAFLPLLGPVVGELAGKPLADLWGDPPELARFTLETRARIGSRGMLFPFDDLVLAEAAGAQVEWVRDTPILQHGAAVEIAALEPDSVLARGRVSAAVETTGYLASEAAAVALLPAPEALILQLGGDIDDEDQLASAEDVCAQFATCLLQSGASAVVVVPGVSGAQAAGIGGLARHFGADFYLLDSRSGVVALDAARITQSRWAPRTAEQDPRIVTSIEPVPAPADFAALSHAAATVEEGGR